MLTLLARFFAVICAILLVPVTCVVIFLQAAGSQLTRAQTYKDALVSEQFYARLPALVGEVVTRVADTQATAGRAQGSVAATDNIAKLLHTLAPRDWETLLGAVAPPAYLQQQLESSLEQFFVYLHADTAPPPGRWSLGAMKQRMVGPEAAAAYAKMLASKPPCTNAQFAAADGLPIDCQPTVEQMPEVLDRFRMVMRTTAEQMPDEFDVFRGLSNIGQSGSALAALAQTRRQVHHLELLGTWSPAVPAALLLLIALFAIRSLRGGLFWCGVPLLVAGAIAAVMAIPTVPVVRWIFAQFIAPALPAEAPAETLQAAVGLLTAVVQQVMTSALYSAGGLALVGLLALILGGLLKSNSRPAAPT